MYFLWKYNAVHYPLCSFTVQGSMPQAYMMGITKKTEYHPMIGQFRIVYVIFGIPRSLVTNGDFSLI